MLHMLCWKVSNGINFPGEMQNRSFKDWQSTLTVSVFVSYLAEVTFCYTASKNSTKHKIQNNIFYSLFTHNIHGTGIFTYICLIFKVNVGKYIIHGSYRLWYWYWI